VAVHAHVDRRALGAAVVEERPGVVECAVDELSGVAEVDRRDRERARGRQDDEIGVMSVELDVRDQAAVREQAQRVQRHPERGARRALQRAGVPRRQDVDLTRAEGDGVRDRGVVGDAAVHELAVLPADGRHDARDRRAGHDRFDERARGEEGFLARDDVHGDDVERDGEVLQPFGLDVVCEQPAQARVGHEVGACTEEPEEAGDRIEGKDLAAPDLSPDGAERFGGLD
jgi:hypothetical protein